MSNLLFNHSFRSSAVEDTIKSLAYTILSWEPLVLLAATFFFWYPTPSRPFEIDRADWLWLLGLIPVIMAARFVVHRRLWTRTPLDAWLAAFIVLCLINIEFAPYESRGLLMLARPLLGIAWIIYLVELARSRRSMEIPLIIMIALGLLVGALAVGSTQWREKSVDFVFIIAYLPSFNPFFADGGFNPNEIAGALAWLIPLMAGAMLYPWQRFKRVWQWAGALAFFMLLLALMVGQSRSAIMGVLPVMLAIILLVVPPGRWRYLSMVGLAFLTVVQLAVLLNLFPQIGDEFVTGERFALSRRDERTTSQRFDIWNSAFEMVADYPLTGVGMARFRYEPVRNRYPVIEFDIPAPGQSDFQRRLVPHAHNEFLQIATDLGLPGLLIFTGWNLTAAYLAWRVWWDGHSADRIIAVSVAAGGVAHLIYGLTDAIPLWDRFSFIYWMVLGLAAAQYIIVRQRSQKN